MNSLHLIVKLNFSLYILVKLFLSIVYSKYIQKAWKEICQYTNCNNKMLLNYISVAIVLDKPIFY